MLDVSALNRMLTTVSAEAAGVSATRAAASADLAVTGPAVIRSSAMAAAAAVVAAAALTTGIRNGCVGTSAIGISAHVLPEDMERRFRLSSPPVTARVTVVVASRLSACWECDMRRKRPSGLVMCAFLRLPVLGCKLSCKHAKSDGTTGCNGDAHQACARTCEPQVSISPPRLPSLTL